MDREADENLSAKQKVARWIEEAVEHLSRQSLESLMDRECVNFCQEKKKERLDRNKSIEKLSSLKKMSFSKRGKTQRDECNKQATQTWIQSTYQALKNISSQEKAKHS